MGAPLDQTLLALTFEQYPDGTNMAKVPHHITVMPWFDASRPGTREVIVDICAETDELVVQPNLLGRVGGEGHEKAACFVQSPDLQLFHKRLFAKLSYLGVVFSHPQWLGNGYSPHYRIGPDYQEFELGQDIQFTSLAVVFNSLGADGAAQKTITNLPFLDRD